MLAVGTRLLIQLHQWGIDKRSCDHRVDADPDEPARMHKPAVALVGDAAPILRAPDRARCRRTTPSAPSRSDEMQERQAKWRGSVCRSSRRSSPSSRRSAPNCRRTASSSTRSRRSALRRALHCRSTSRAHSFRPAIRTISAGAMRPRSARRTRGATCRWSVDQRRRRLHVHGNELATAMRHRIPLVAIVFADGAFGNVRRIQQEAFGNRLIACDLANPDFVKFAESFGAAADARSDRRNCARRCGRRSSGATADPDRDAGRTHAEPLGIHLMPQACADHEAGCRRPTADRVM